MRGTSFKKAINVSLPDTTNFLDVEAVRGDLCSRFGEDRVEVQRHCSCTELGVAVRDGDEENEVHKIIRRRLRTRPVCCSPTCEKTAEFLVCEEEGRKMYEGYTYVCGDHLKFGLETITPDGGWAVLRSTNEDDFSKGVDS
jgi:hypothetical protein